MSQLFEKFHFHDSHVQLSNAKNRMFLSALDRRTAFFGAHFIALFDESLGIFDAPAMVKITGNGHKFGHQT